MTKAMSTRDYIKRAIKIHGDKYDYSMVSYKNSVTKVKVVCPKHGLFEVRPLNHTHHKSGCPLCAPAGRPQNTSITTDEFIKRSKKIHKNRYDYSLVKYKNTHTKVEIVCSKHGVFYQLPVKHLQKCGCPRCNKPSRNEELVVSFLNNHKIVFIKEHTFNSCRNPTTKRVLKFDFFIPYRNLVIEVDGEHHFKATRYNGMSIDQAKACFEGTVRRDKIKNRFLKKNGIRLIRLSYQFNKNEIEGKLRCGFTLRN